MGLAENLVQGLASAAGATDTVNAIQKNKDDRRATQHEELEANTKRIFDDLKGLHARKQSLDINSPTYKQDAAAIDADIQKVGTTFHDLYHPANNPTALHHLGGFIKQHLLRQPAPPATPGEAKESIQQMMSDLDIHAAAPPPVVNPYIQKRQQLTAAGANPEEIQRNVFGDKPDAESWAPVNVKLPDGSEVTWQRNSKNGEWTDLAGNPISKDKLAGATMTGKGAESKPVRAWIKKGGKTTSVLIDPKTNKAIPGSENPDILPPSTMTGRVSTGYYHFVDSDGNVHQVQETRTSSPAGSGGIPKNAGEAKDSLKKAAGDNVIGKKETSVQASAHKEYIVADKLSVAADLAAKEPDNAQGQKSLAVALERAAAGRFTTQALDYILKAGWTAGAEQFWNNIDNGTLPKVVIRNLIQRAHDNKDSAYAAWQESLKPSGDSSDKAASFSVPTGAPSAPKEDGHKLKANGKVIAVSKGGTWVAPQ